MGCSKAPELKSLYVAPHCLSSQSLCTIETQYGQFSLLFNVDKVITEQSFTITLKAISKDNSASEQDKIDLSKFEISAFLEGRDMYMGKIPLFFKQGANGEFSAEALLGSCSEETMFWRLSLELKNNEVSHLHNQNVNKNVFTDRFSIDFESTRS